MDVPLASLGTRALAHLLDSLILFVGYAATIALVVLILGAGFLPGAFEEATELAIIVAVLAIFGLQYGYFAIFELVWQGQTPGKRAMNLRVVTLDGTTAGAAAILTRNLIRIVDFLPPSYGIGATVMVCTKKSQRLGDLVAGTIVVRERDVDEIQLTRFPESFTADDVELVKACFARRSALDVTRYRELTRALLSWLEQKHSDFFHSHDDADRLASQTPEALVESLFQPTIPQ